MRSSKHLECSSVDGAIGGFRGLINSLHRLQGKMIQERMSWYKVCSSMDVIGHTEGAIKSYESKDSPENLGELYLLAYGLFQSLVVQQNAVNDLFSSLGVVSPIKENTDLKYIRDIRNDCIGHPTARNRGVEPRSNFFYSLHWSIDHFTLNRSYYDGENENDYIDVYPKDLISKQRAIIESAIKDASQVLKDRENEHREQYRGTTFQSLFNGYSYCFEKLHTHFIDSPTDHTALSVISFKELVNNLQKFRDEISRRGLDGVYESIDYKLERIEHPVQRLQDYFSGKNVSQKDAESFTRDFNNLYDDMFKMAGELDEDYSEVL